jgi:UDP-glucose 4-epimerase
MSSYLVTGGAGFIGSNIVEELLKRGETVRVLDNFSEGTRENLDLAKRHSLSTLDYELIEGDIRDISTCLLACRNIDYVLHQAALCSVPRSVDEPSETNEVNIRGTLNVLLAAKEARVKRVVCASSAAVYGDSAKLPQSETETPTPLSPYAVSKLAAEYYCVVFNKIYGLETVCLRYFNVFGPRQNPASQYATVIPRFILSSLHGRPLEIHGDGLQSRDFIYVSNVVEANIVAATAPNSTGEVINIGCEEQHSVLDVAETIAQILGKKLEHCNTKPRLGDVRHSRADISRAKRLLGCVNRVTFVEGMRKTIEYFEKSGYQR